jgi:hypothetical protein
VPTGVDSLQGVVHLLSIDSRWGVTQSLPYVTAILEISDGPSEGSLGGLKHLAGLRHGVGEALDGSDGISV